MERMNTIKQDTMFFVRDLGNTFAIYFRVVDTTIELKLKNGATQASAEALRAELIANVQSVALSNHHQWETRRTKIQAEAYQKGFDETFRDNPIGPDADYPSNDLQENYLQGRLAGFVAMKGK